MSLRTEQPRIRSVIVVPEEESKVKNQITADIDQSTGEQPHEMIDEEEKVEMEVDIKKEDE